MPFSINSAPVFAGASSHPQAQRVFQLSMHSFSLLSVEKELADYSHLAQHLFSLVNFYQTIVMPICLCVTSCCFLATLTELSR